ncbi:MAG: cyclic-di-AMP receptor [Acutalibacteraceae bacterium]|jgi:uncharacterized protein YaaQ
MKLIIAIVNKDDSNAISTALTQEGFSVTRMASVGGFLMAPNATLLMGADDSRVDEIIAIVEKHSKKRTKMVSSAAYGAQAENAIPMELTVGGATIFVTDVERFERV